MFTDDEIELLMDALDALESKAGNMMLLTGLLGIGLSRTPDEAEKARLDIEREWEEEELKQKGLKNRIILIKAKLLQLQDKNAVDEMKRFMEG